MERGRNHPLPFIDIVIDLFFHLRDSQWQVSVSAVDSQCRGSQYKSQNQNTRH